MNTTRAASSLSRRRRAAINKVILIGRLTRNPEVRYSQDRATVCVTRYTLAVDRRIKKDGEPEADFIPCVAIGKAGEHAGKFFQKGLKIAVTGRLQTGAYTRQDGIRIRTMDVIVEEQEYVERKEAAGNGGPDNKTDPANNKKGGPDNGGGINEH